MVTDDSGWRDEKNGSVPGIEIPRDDEVQNMVKDSRRVHLPPAQNQQGPVFDNAGDDEDSRVLRYKERSGTILAGVTHLLENWEPKRLPHICRPEEEIEVTPLIHKTVKVTRQMSLILYYWNDQMKHAIRSGLEPGPLDEKMTKPLEEMLTKKKVRWHSIRRTAIQTYIDCNVPLENIRAITLHKDDETLLSYVGTIRPIVDKERPRGMAISHAPFIWKIQNNVGKDVLRMF